MSDFVWIAFIIIVYMVVIRPMVQGVLQKPEAKNEGSMPQNKKGSANQKKDDYVDYEEVD